jgi:LAO/AO transport system kinase
LYNYFTLFPKIDAVAIFFPFLLYSPMRSVMGISLKEELGNNRNLAKTLSAVENRSPRHLEILKECFRLSGRARIIGITGPPGAGKSTLTASLLKAFRKEGRKVGVLAIDPSSSFSGGALLGDRIRMMEMSLDENVFIRSIATRGAMGGLSLATSDMITVMDAAGFDIILVETVGVGQDEVDIIKEADSVLLVLVPGFGDDIQALKAGIMEIADIFVVNKADKDGAEKLEREIESLLSLSPLKKEWTTPVVRTVATKDTGIGELAGRLEAHYGFLKDSSMLVEKKRQRGAEKLRRLLIEGLERQLRRGPLAGEEEEKLKDAFLSRENDPYTAAEDILGALSWEGTQ